MKNTLPLPAKNYSLSIEPSSSCNASKNQAVLSLKGGQGYYFLTGIDKFQLLSKSVRIKEISHLNEILFCSNYSFFYLKSFNSR